MQAESQEPILNSETSTEQSLQHHNPPSETTMLDTLNKRISELEAENNDLLHQLSERNTKVDTLENRVQSLELESQGLKSIVNQLRQEYRGFVNKVYKDLMLTDNKSLNLSQATWSSTPRSNTLLNRKSDSTSGATESEHRKSFNDIAELFLKNESDRASMLSSLVIRPSVLSNKSDPPASTEDRIDMRSSMPAKPRQKTRREMRNLTTNELETFRRGMSQLDTRNSTDLSRSVTFGDVPYSKETTSKMQSNIMAYDPLLSTRNLGEEDFGPYGPDDGAILENELDLQAKLQNVNYYQDDTTDSHQRPIFDLKNLFENFVVFGLTQETLADRLSFYKDRFKSGDFISFKPKPVYSFAEAAKLEQNILPPEIEKFISPLQSSIIRFGVKNINDHIFNKVIFKTQRKYKERYICPFRPHDEKIQISKWTEYANTINPQNKLYAMCVKKRDYMVLDSLKDNKDNFFYFDTIYCLLTYAPIPNFAFDLLVSVINFIAKRRREIYALPRKKKHPRDVDFSKIDTILRNEILNHIQHILNLGVPGPEKPLNYDFSQTSVPEHASIEYKCPPVSNAHLELATWGAHKIFSIFSLEDVNLILSGLLLEKPVIIFSKNIVMLTSAINTFLGLLFPFKYVCTLVSSVPPNGQSLFESPIPFLIGANRHEQYFWEKELDQKSQAIFVFLDLQVIYIDARDADLISFPKLGFIFDNLKDNVYPYTSNFKVVTDTLALSEIIPPWTTEQENVAQKYVQNPPNTFKPENNEAQAQKVFEYFRTQLEQNIVYILTTIMNSHGGKANHEQFREAVNGKVKDEDLKEFLHAFTETQIFNSYPYSLTRPWK